MSQDLKDAHPDVPWRQISRLRNRLIHGYFDIELDLVWKTVEEDLPVWVQELQNEQYRTTWLKSVACGASGFAKEMLRPSRGA